MEMLITTQLDSLPKIEWNYTDVLAWVKEGTGKYVGWVITEEQLPDAKKERANLNKLKTVLEDKRKEVKKAVNKPYEDFEKQIKEVTGLIDKTIGDIDVQIKEYDAQKKEEKRNEVKVIFEGIPFPDWLKLGQIWNEKWLNATYSLAEITKEMHEFLTTINQNVEIINSQPDYQDEMMSYYKENLNLASAMAVGTRLRAIAKEKAEREAAKAVVSEPIKEMPVTEEISTAEVERKWIAFEAYLSMDEAKALAQFFRANNIEFKKG